MSTNNNPVTTARSGIMPTANPVVADIQRQLTQQNADPNASRITSIRMTTTDPSTGARTMGTYPCLWNATVIRQFEIRPPSGQNTENVQTMSVRVGGKRIDCVARGDENILKQMEFKVGDIVVVASRDQNPWSVRRDQTTGAVTDQYAFFTATAWKFVAHDDRFKSVEVETNVKLPSAEQQSATEQSAQHNAAE